MKRYAILCIGCEEAEKIYFDDISDAFRYYRDNYEHICEHFNQATPFIWDAQKEQLHEPRVYRDNECINH